MPAVHPEVIVDNVTDDHNEIHEDYAKAWNRRERMVPCVTDGVTDNTAMIEFFHDEATPGDMLVLPRGPIAANPFTLSKMLHFRGAGRFSTWFVPLSNSTDPMITVDRTIDSGHGIFANYGPILEGFGIQRLGHMAGPCIHLTDNSPWTTLRNILCSGGTRSLEHHAPNSTLEDLFLWDASDAMIDMDESGLELHMRHVVMSANVNDLDTFIRCIISAGAAGTLLGAIYIDDVTGNTAGGGITVNNGLVISAPLNSPPGGGETVYTELPTFCEKLILDNINGGGPVVTLDNIATFNLVNSWLNGTNGCVDMDGCVTPQFSTNRYRGGTHTYGFGTGAVTQGFQSEGCESATGPMYKVGGSNKPDTIWTNDNVRGSSTIAQVTNDPEWFLDAHRRAWQSLRLQGMFRQREDGDSPPQGFANLVAGVLVVPHDNVQTNTRVEFWRGTTGATGTPGLLQHDVADNVAGTSFTIKSTDLTDTGRVHWRFLGDKD